MAGEPLHKGTSFPSLREHMTPLMWVASDKTCFPYEIILSKLQ